IQNYPGWVRSPAAEASPEAQGNFATLSAQRCGMLGEMGLLSGGPDWVRTAMWDVEAGIPEGMFTTKPNLLTDPKIQQMIQALLAERFKLVFRRETREVSVYLLKVGK